MKKSNLLVIGASGAVAGAFLHHLFSHRDLIKNLILLDRTDGVLKDCYLNHKGLSYTFIQKEIELPKKEKEYHNLLKKYNIDIVLDLSTMDTIPLLESTNKFGVSYLGTAANDEKNPIYQTLHEILRKRDKYRNAAHLMCSGMNPGVVNMWVRVGVEEYGVPKEIVHFEYDTSTISKGWRPIMTWSIKEFLEEVVTDPSAVMLGGYKIKEAKTSAIMQQVDMKSILKPIINLDKYPYGFVVPHEECTTIAYKYNIPSKYIYAFDIDTMKRLVAKYKKVGKITSHDLIFGDNISNILEGSDSIGVLLKYNNKIICFFNSISNQSLTGENATCLQVAIGVFAGLFTLILEKLKPKLYFPEDLYNTHYKNYVVDNIRTQKYVFKKTNKGLKLVHHDPCVKIETEEDFKHLYIF